MAIWPGDPQPDQIDMMSENELRDELRRVLSGHSVELERTKGQLSTALGKLQACELERGNLQAQNTDMRSELWAEQDHVVKLEAQCKDLAKSAALNLSRLDEALADARYWRVTAGDVDGELKKATGRIDAQALEAATLRNQEIEYQDTDDENERLKSRLDKIIQSRDALKGEARGYFEQVQLAERREHDLLQRIERLRDWIQERADADCPYGEPDFEACGHNRKHGICASHAAAKVLAQDIFVSDAPVVEKPLPESHPVDWIDLVPPTAEHDMIRGPCKCGATH